MAGTTEPEQHGTRRGTDKKTWETRERHRTSIFWENVLSHVWRCRYNVFFSKKYQEIVVFHKHKLTMAGTTEPEQHGTRTGIEKKNTRNTRIQRQKNVRKGVPPPWVHFYKGKKMYSRASHPLEYIFTRAKNVLKGVPPPCVHFYNGKKCTQGRPTPLSTFLQRQKMYWRASHPLEYIFTTAKNVLEGVPPPWVHFYNGKNVLEGVPPPWVHFYKGKKCTGGRPTPLSTFLQGQKKCTQGRPTPLSTFLHCKKKNVTTHVGRPWVHFLYSLSVKKMYWRGWEALEYIFILPKKKSTQGGGTPLSTFSLLIPRQENVLKGVVPPPVHFQKKMYRHKGDVFLLYLFWGGGFLG